MAVAVAVLWVASAAAGASAATQEAQASPPAFQDRDRQAKQPVQVRIEGVSGALRRNVRSRLSILDPPPVEAVLEARIKRDHRRAEQEIRAALEPFGHYRPTVDGELRSDGPGRWTAVYRIDPGPPVTFGEVDLRVSGPGGDDVELRRVLRRSEIEEGAPLRHPEWDRLKARLVGVAHARGYLDASFRRSRVEVDLERYRAAAELHLETGPRYRFGRVRFTDTIRFSPSFYRRLATVEPGAPYSLARLRELRELVASSGYFRRVEVDAPRDSADGLEVPVLIRAEVRPRSALSFGAGVTTDRGPRVGVEWGLRHLGPHGHRVRTELRASPQRQTATLAYSLPVGIPGHEEATAAAGFRREAFEEVTTRGIHAAVGVTHRRGAWRESAQLRWEREWFSVAGAEETATLVVPRLAWSRTSGDELLQPSHGSRVSLEVEGASTALGSDMTFLQARARGKIVRSLYPGGRVLARASIGATAVDELGSLPTSLRFFAGGDESVRGYAYNSLGPTDAAGEVAGGRHLLVGSLEFDQRVAGPFGTAVFVDAGTAVAELSRVDEPAVGAGVGARWRSPVGPVRLDVAFAFDRPGTPARLHLVMGPDL